jgi:hypothetical protein
LKILNYVVIVTTMALSAFLTGCNDDSSTTAGVCPTGAESLTLAGLGISSYGEYSIAIGAPLSEGERLATNCGYTMSEFQNSDGDITVISFERNGLEFIFNPNEAKLEEIIVSDGWTGNVVVDGEPTINLATGLDLMQYFPMFEDATLVGDTTATYQLVEDVLTLDMYITFNEEGEMQLVKSSTNWR